MIPTGAEKAIFTYTRSDNRKNSDFVPRAGEPLSLHSDSLVADKIQL